MQDEIDAAVKTLLDLKAEYKNVTGKDFPVAKKVSKPKENKNSTEKKVVKHKASSKEKKVVEVYKFVILCSEISIFFEGVFGLYFMSIFTTPF